MNFNKRSLMIIVLSINTTRAYNLYTDNVTIVVVYLTNVTTVNTSIDLFVPHDFGWRMFSVMLFSSNAQSKQCSHVLSHQNIMVTIKIYNIVHLSTDNRWTYLTVCYAERIRLSFAVAQRFFFAIMDWSISPHVVQCLN